MDTPAIDFRVNDFVFAKMSGYPPWPAIVMPPDPLAPTKPSHSQWIYFFGSHNYAWIEEKHIKLFETYKEKFKVAYKLNGFKEAVEELENIIENMQKDPDYKIAFIKYSAKGKPTSAKKPRKSTGSLTLGTPKRPLPLKEKNNSVPKKKSRLSILGADEVNDDGSTHSPIPAVDRMPKILNTANMLTSDKTFGFWAGNVYAGGIIKNLIKSGHRLNIWSRSTALCEELEEYAEQQQSYLKTFDSPLEVATNSEIIFSCLSDPDQPKMMFLELAQSDWLDGKGYVELTSIDPERSKDLSDLVKQKNGIYLEAMVQGCRDDAIKGELVALIAGSKQLFLQLQTCFKSMAKATFFLGDEGAACKTHLILQVMRGIFLSGVTEGFAMADKCGIKLNSFHRLFNYTDLSSSYLNSKIDMILERNFSPAEEPLQQLQKDLALSLEMSNKYRQPMPLASNANEILKHARRLGYDNQDSSCIYNRTRY